MSVIMIDIGWVCVRMCVGWVCVRMCVGEWLYVGNLDGAWCFVCICISGWMVVYVDTVHFNNYIQNQFWFGGGEE